MQTIAYRDSRDLDPSQPSFSRAVVQGIAPGGGLYVPASLPPLDLQDILAMAEWPYWRRAAAVFTHFGVDLPAQRVEALMRRAYGRQWDHEAIEAALRELPATLGVKPKVLFQAVRVAVTGSVVSPPLFESLALMGKDVALRRMRSAL